MASAPPPHVIRNFQVEVQDPALHIDYFFPSIWAETSDQARSIAGRMVIEEVERQGEVEKLSLKYQRALGNGMRDMLIGCIATYAVPMLDHHSGERIV